MAYKNLLVGFKPGDEHDSLLEKFLHSLPDETTKIFESFGYEDGLMKNMIKTEFCPEENKKHLLFLRLSSFDNLFCDYFLNNKGTFLKEIPDFFNVKVCYKRHGMDFSLNELVNFNYDGSFDEMLKLYDNIVSYGIFNLSDIYLNSDQDEMKKFTRRGVFYKEKRATSDLFYISVGLETASAEYLLKTTGKKGPYYSVICKK
ncbi:hypothetical protein JXB41_01795 [Candidatus Woesearchaeota archaeon]|nr:hypothetical protein [Candidatus Woesearchaeota archaeon]